ncbi:AGR213Cp [Eremothecium gossypii ATCC 10895]|uniref:AGR213Cp n=1 Tax=Eremothecium gossypii (strain ATCC 10895 / CBS 109.51 / FGSC 9923 / NRRL Y-1056) TaxID=284811 RepID=Q74ZI9_EREGS|nr:AGR213Cp [Eremothecium gossypii ATCC 10895]AAS54703.1 AGR213Cp [Eremothecium gossypii ATCC 10895]AEY99033.1 FAGR213Cp [Eremothecium gossypii FDAG1]
MSDESSRTLLPRPGVMPASSTMSLRSYRAIKVDKPLRHDTKSYVSYYLPILRWLPEYSWGKMAKDMLAGLTLTSFQIPLAISLTTMAHVSPYAGLYALVIPPLIYAVFGSVPTMVVGPQTVASLVVGQSCDAWAHKSLEPLMTVAVIGCISGVLVFAMGIFRLGFIDNAISKAFLKGFTSALAVVMLITELLPQLQIDDRYKQALKEGKVGSAAWDKLVFALENAREYSNPFSVKLSVAAFSILLLSKYLKKYLTAKYGWTKLTFFPDLLLVVLGSILLSFYYDWDNKYNLPIVGDLPPNKDHIKVPIQSFQEFKDLFDASFLVAILGLFESATAFKSISATFDIDVSSNRELVSLGLINIVGSVFSSLPAFGGYGRSKLNIFCGAQTPMAGIFVSLSAIFCMRFLMGVFHYLPLCILAVIISFIAYNLLEEVPGDMFFYWSVSGYQELITFSAVVLSTLIWSPQFGLVMGLGLTMIRLLKHTTQSRIQILGKDPITKKFRNIYSEHNEEIPLEEIEKTMVIKVPEPLVFWNVPDLMKKVKRLEKYGSLYVHPSYPTSLRPVSGVTTLKDNVYVKYIIMDLLGMTYIDMSALQALVDMVVNYHKRGIYVIFCRSSIRDLKNKFDKSGITRLQADFISRQLLYQEGIPHDHLQFLKLGLYGSVDEAVTAVDMLEVLSSTSSGTAQNGRMA